MGNDRRVDDEMITDGDLEDKLVHDIERSEERLRQVEIEAEEAIMPKGFSKIYTPSKEEFEKHCLTHLPYRNWCPICVQAKKNNPGHHRISDERGIPIFSMDYMFLNGKESLSFPILVITESQSGGIWAIAVKRKGS